MSTLSSNSKNNEALEKEAQWVKVVTYDERDVGVQKLIRKFIENPIVPLGALVTVGALSNGLYNMSKGDKHKQQWMMRLRVTAQGITIAAAVIGVLIFQQTKAM